MSLINVLNEDIKKAMKAKDKPTLAVLRMLKSAIQNEQINKGQPLTADEELTVLAREMKQRKDSLESFTQAGRDDLVEQVKAEIVVVETYMPKQLTETELNTILSEVIQQVGATSMKDFGKVMGAAMPRVKGKADGTQVQSLVKQLLKTT